MEYIAINEQDKLQLAQDLLRGRESDHYRLSLLDEPAKEARLADLEKQIETLREEVEDQLAAAGAEEEE